MKITHFTQVKICQQYIGHGKTGKIYVLFLYIEYKSAPIENAIFATPQDFLIIFNINDNCISLSILTLKQTD
jgi:hypothetical protein